MTTSTAPDRRFLIAFLVLLGAGVVFNVVWELSLPDSRVAIRRAASDDMISLANAEKASLPGKVGFALSLRSVASGGVLVAPEKDTVERRQVVTLANMSLRLESYDSVLQDGAAETLPAADRIEGEGKLHFADGEPVPYVIVWDASRGPVEVLRLFTTPNGLVIVIDDRLVAGLAQ